MSANNKLPNISNNNNLKKTLRDLNKNFEALIRELANVLRKQSNNKQNSNSRTKNETANREWKKVIQSGTSYRTQNSNTNESTGKSSKRKNQRKR